ncbi:MAG: Type 1 glutamine amidotransferase-like domain-containing protein [Alphaproteobacteria bacterium]|nr:Type 1 glutamine amidotransferase-like domain-containing protein [Alphaproteobacteria bacterium]
MTKTIIAIGGGEMGRIKIHDDGRREQKPWETEKADRKIVELTGKEHPVLVFIGAASNDSPSYFPAVCDVFEKKLGCITKNLILTDLSQRPNQDKIREMVMGADIVYVGGGNVTRLMKVLKETGTDKILKEAYDNGVIMSGNSAGGCVWFEYYDNDEDEDFDGTENTFTTKRALGFVKGYFCPHWNKKTEYGIDKEVTSKDVIKRMLIKESKFGYAVDEPAAIMIQTDSDKQIMSEIISVPGAGVYKLSPEQKQYINLGNTRD